MINHPFVSGKADPGDATLVKPSDWNAGHVQLRTVSANTTLPANSSTVIVGDLEIASNFALELAADAVLEIA